MSDAAAAPGLAAATRAIEQALADALALEPAPVAPDLADAAGTWKGEPVRLTTRAWSGPLVRRARFATVVGGGLEIGNLLVVMRDELALPILGADLVSLGARGAGTMLAADLSPTLPAGAQRDAQLAGLAAAMREYADLPPGGELPGWCAAWFSPHALYTRPAPAQLPRALEALGHFPRALVALARTAAPRPDLRAVAALARRGYAAAHREDDKGLGMLAKIVSPEWASRYVGEVLFPD